MTPFSSRFTHQGRILWRLFAVLVGLSLNMPGGVANAQEVAVSFSGIISPGQIDTYGVFGRKGGNLGNQPFSVSMSYDASAFSLFASSSGYYYDSEVGGALTISVTINGVTSSLTNVGNAQPYSAVIGIDLCCLSNSGLYYDAMVVEKTKNDPLWQVEYYFPEGNSTLTNPQGFNSGDEVILIFYSWSPHAGYKSLILLDRGEDFAKM